MKTTVSELTFTASECARQTGLTVKALRVYERAGLLKPKRTLKDWRVYDASDLTRLGEITALRALGLKLSTIAELLRGKVSDINQVLELQQSDLMQRRKQIETGLATITKFRSRTAAGDALTINDLATAIKESQMNSTSHDTHAWKRYDQMRPRVAVAANAKNMKSCCGDFRFDGGVLIHVFLEHDKLMAQIPGQPALQLFPEAPDAYFYKEVHAQIVFSRDTASMVDALTLHQDGFEQKALKINEREAKDAVAKLKSRMKVGHPHTESKRLIEELLVSHRLGLPRLDLMAPELATLAVEQNESITRDLVALGNLKALTFLAVTPSGWDAYRATFENGELDVSIFIANDGKISGASLEPPKAESFWKQLYQRFEESLR